MYDSTKMFLATIAGDHKKVAQFLKTDPTHERINELFLNLNSYLFHVVNRSLLHPYIPEHYQCIILLLDAGADPFQSQIEYEQFKNISTPFYVALQNHNLAAVRLMLWYNPEYENIFITPGTRPFTAVDMAKYIDETKYPGYAKSIADTANEARRMRPIGWHNITTQRLLMNLNKLLLSLQPKPILKSTYLITDKPPEAYRPILINYYQQKQFECLANTYQCYQLIHENLTKAPTLTAPFKQYHIEVLDRFLTLHRILKEGFNKILAFYRTLKIDAPEGFLALHTTIKENDPKTLALLTQLAKLRSEMDASSFSAPAACSARGYYGLYASRHSRTSCYRYH